MNARVGRHVRWNDAKLAVSTGIAAGVSNGIGTVAAGVASQFGFRKSDPGSFQLTSASDPTSFFGKKASELQAKDLYRENGNLGFKRVEQDGAGTEAYAPIAGDDRLKVAVYKFEPATGQMHAAFRILKAQPIQFKPIVDAVAAKLRQQPRYSGMEGVMRAVWSDGTFVAADANSVTAGWSEFAADSYAVAGQAQ